MLSHSQTYICLCFKETERKNKILLFWLVDSLESSRQLLTYENIRVHPSLGGKRSLCFFSHFFSLSIYPSPSIFFSSFTRDNWKFLHLHFFLYTLFYLFYVLCRTTAYFPAQYTDWTCMQRGKNIEKSHSEEKMKTDKWTGQRNKADEKKEDFTRGHHHGSQGSCLKER